MDIALPCGRTAIIDADDFEKVRKYSWRYSAGEYGHGAVVAWDRDIKWPVLLHRLIMEAPKGVEVDHINRNVLDNRRTNLRLCSRKENSRNRNYTKSNGLPKGVHWRTGSSTYRAAISVDGEFISLGSFRDPITAAVAYDEAAIKYFGEFARLNFSKERDWILPNPQPTTKTLKIRGAA